MYTHTLYTTRRISMDIYKFQQSCKIVQRQHRDRLPYHFLLNNFQNIYAEMDK